MNTIVYASELVYAHLDIAMAEYFSHPFGTWFYQFRNEIMFSRTIGIG